MTSDSRFAVTALSPDEQRAQWLAEHGKAGEGEGEVGGEGEEADDEGEGQRAGEPEEKEKDGASDLSRLGRAPLTPTQR